MMYFWFGVSRLSPMCDPAVILNKNQEMKNKLRDGNFTESLIPMKLIQELLTSETVPFYKQDHRQDVPSACLLCTISAFFVFLPICI